MEYKNYTKREVTINGQVIPPHHGPKSMKQIPGVKYIIPDKIAWKLNYRNDIISERDAK